MNGHPHLIVVEGEGVGRVFALSKPITTIGRDPAGDVVLSHATVSWHHATITADRDRFLAKDLGSRNGTFVGVERIVRRELLAGDLLAIGDRVALKLAFAGPDERTPAAAGDRGSVPLVANAAALLDRLRKERAGARDPDSSLVMMFVGLPRVPASAGSIEELMRPLALACRQALDAGDLLARAAERELIVLLRSTTAQALLAGGRIRAAVTERLTTRAGAAAPAIVVVPVPFHATVGAEALLLVAARRATETMRDAPGAILTVPLHESLH